MLKYRLSFFAIFLFLSVLNSQNIKKADTVLIRYNGEISSDYRFNTIKLYELQGDSVYNVTEIYKFTNPPSIKSQHQENLDRVKHGYFNYRDANGVTTETGNYLNGKKHGVWRTYRNDTLKSRYVYNNGNKEGRSYHYYLGDKYYLKYWKNDKLNGRINEYDSKGTLVFKGQYNEGNLEGLNTWFFKNGNKQKEGFYSRGELNGESKSYYENGSIYSEGTCIEGKKVGEWFWYYSGGKIASEELYNSKGKIKRAKFYDIYGNSSNGKRNIVEGVIDERKALNRRIKEHVKNNFSYPKSMQENGFEGRIFVVFKVSKTGEIIDIQARGEAHELLVEKAKSIIRLLPNQEPAKHHNLRIDVPFVIPIVFHLKD